MEASNPIVRSVLVPVLQLASYIISHSYMFGWWVHVQYVFDHTLISASWDAIFFGKIDDVPKNELPIAFQNRRFARLYRRNRDECYSEQGQKQLQDAFLQAAGDVDWFFQAGRSTCFSGLPVLGPNAGGAYGLTDDGIIGSPKVFITFELLEPMLSANLNKSEIALDIFRAANTLLHELAVCHTCWASIFLLEFGTIADTSRKACDYLHVGSIAFWQWKFKWTIFRGWEVSLSICCPTTHFTLPLFFSLHI